MHVTIEKKSLARSLSKIYSIAERRSSIPILANVKIQANPSSMTISVTDMDLYATDVVLSNTLEPGECTMPAHLLFDIIKKLPDNAVVSISKSQNIHEGVNLKSGSVECNLPTLSPEDFPNFPDDKYESCFSLVAKKFKTLLTKTKYAISTEETRYYLNGTYLHAVLVDDAWILRAVATDSHRLAAAETNIGPEIKEMPGVLIPRKTVNEIIKLLEEDIENITISISAHKIMLKIGSTTLISKLIDGKFPDYKKAIPSQTNKLLEIDVIPLSNALDLVTTVSSDKAKPVKISIEKSLVTLSVHSNTNGSSKASQQISASYNNDPIEVAFNGKYMLDVLSTIEGTTATFAILDSTSAVLVKDGANHSAIHVLMPMQV